MFVKHESFPSDAAFTEAATNQDVYYQSVQPLVDHTIRGGVATVFMYGQTGSGKTHTMTGLEELAAGDIFTALGSHMAGGGRVSLAYFEIAGKSLNDLLGEQGAHISLRDDGEGGMQVRGAAEETVSTAEELLGVIAKGKSRRATRATEVNAVSSRSHAVLRITIVTSEGAGTEGRLTLVDCAGSERNADSMYHTADMRKEGAEINASLHALKECFRAMASNNPNAHVPFRQSNLTKVLMETFTREGALTAMVATLAPGPTDTEHTIGTLRTVCMLAGTEGEVLEKKEDVPLHLPRREEATLPAKWTPAQLAGWVRKVDGARFVGLADSIPKGTTGKEFVRWGAHKFTKLCGGNEAAGSKLYGLLRDEMDRVNKIEGQKRDDRRQALANEKHSKRAGEKY